MVNQTVQTKGIAKLNIKILIIFLSQPIRECIFQYGFETPGLEPVLSHTKISCIVSFYIQFFMDSKMYNHNIKTISGLTKLVLIL